ncbi:hypothetical protein MASR2M47_13780 [Draconibacterium sp.]
MAFLNAKNAPVKLKTYTIKADITGAAACIQGYVALEGLGITRIKNQIVETTPITIKLTLVGIDHRSNFSFNDLKRLGIPLFILLIIYILDSIIIV